MNRKVIKSNGDDKNMVIYVESSTFFQRLFKKPVTITKYVGRGTVWYKLPSYTRAPVTDEYWLTGACKKILYPVQD